MSVDHKLESLNERKRDVERELAGLAESKQNSGNTALGDLELALVNELDQLQSHIGQIRAYMSACQELAVAAG
jgi:hypothetical protein